MNVWAKRVVAVVSLLVLGAGTAFAVPLGTGFTYQGQLNENGSPVTGTAHFRFSLWDAASGGVQVGTHQIVANVAVAGGVFTVTLNQAAQFTSAAFNGNARWLQIEVCTDAGCGTRTTLTPRQPLTGAPYALQASDSKTLTNIEGGGVAVQINPDTRTNSAGLFTGRFHHDLLLGSFLDGSVSHAFLSSGYTAGARKISIGRASSSDFTTAVFQPQLTVVSNTGNVGIGTSTPAFPLSFPNTLGQKISLYSLPGGGPNYGIGVQPGLLQIHTDAGGDDIAFGYGSSDNFTERVRIEGTGNVGIGTSAPLDKVHVVGGRVRIENDLAAAGQENLRIIRGSIFGNGNIQYGSGFTVADGPGTGRFTITFNVPFAGAPTIVATPNYCAGCFVTIVQVESVSSTAAVVSAVYRHDGSYASSAGPLSFVAIGPR